ncbi:MAG: membrane protein insertase YidC [Clostridia bacterium]|nr:membrane protein insertase YidC [Clostridia bacterium]
MCSSIFGPINTVFGYLLKFCCTISGGYYILALFFFTLIMQILLFPLGIKQQKSSIKMAKVKPKEMLIREKYSGRTDRVTQQKMNMEIQELYRNEGTSMFGGCLPLLLQLPIIIILWSVIQQPLTYTSKGNVDVTAQYNTAAMILDGAIASIDDSGLLNTDEPKTDETSEAVSGEISQTGTPADVSAEQRDRLKQIRDSYVGLIKSFGGSDDCVNSSGRYKTDFISADNANYKENTRAEFSLVQFIIYNYRYQLMKELEANEVSQEIIAKNMPESLDFSDEVKESLPNFTYLGGSETLLDTPKNKGFSLLLLIPLVIFLTSVLSFVVNQKLSPMASTNPNGAGGGFLLKWGLPLFSTYLAWATFPAAVGMYWIYRTVLQMGQTFLLSKMYPVPVVTEAELEEYKKQMKAKKKKTITIEVDEDDTSYDHLAVKKQTGESSGAAGSDTDSSSGYDMLKADNTDVKSKVDWAPLKEDDDKKKD